MIKKEFTTCDLCGKDDYNLIYTERGHNIVECKNCKLIYVNPRLSFQDYKMGLELEYTDLVLDSLKDLGKDIPKLKTQFQHKRVNIASWLKKRLLINKRDLQDIRAITKTKGRILDVGCAEGYFLKYASDEGWDAYGIEPAKRHLPKKGWNLKVFNCFLEDANLEKNSFDVITLWDTLEHTPAPSKILLQANYLLKKDGLLAIRVPNVNYLLLKTFIITHLFGKNVYLKTKLLSHQGFFAPEAHFYNFSYITLKKILEKHNFKIIKQKIANTSIGNSRFKNWLYQFLTLSSLISRNIFKINLHTSLQVYAKKLKEV